MLLVNLNKGELTGVANYVWDTNTLDWVKATGSTADGSEVSVTNFPASQAITASSLPLPTGAGTSANQLLIIDELQTLTATQAETTRVDEASATVTYLGKAPAGTAEASAAWKIQRITVSGTITEIEYADGDANYNNIWNNRASLSYS